MAGDANGTVTNRKGKKDEKVVEEPKVDKEEKAKPSLADINHQKNVATIAKFMIPCILMVYFGLVFSKQSIKELNPLLTNKYFLLGFKDLQTLKDALTANLVDSAVWGLTYIYIRRWCNPEYREKTHTFVQDGYFAGLASFFTALIKQVIRNLNK